MASMGWQVFGQILEQMAHPNLLMQDAIEDSVLEGDARADMTTFISRYDCTEYVNQLLRNAVRYFQDPSSSSHGNASLGLEKDRIEAANVKVALAGSQFFPLERRDVPEPCNSNPRNSICKPALDEFNLGTFGAIKCGYYNRSIDKTWNYFFWSKTVPSNLMALAINDASAAIKALGSVAVQECPKSQDEAEAIYRANDRR